MNPARLRIWPSLPPSAYVAPASWVLPFPLDQPNCHLFSIARHGLWHGIRAVGLGPNDAVLAPAYHHGSEIEVLHRAGLKCLFYDVTEDLQPDLDQLESLLDERVRALYVIHYFGFPQDAGEWRRWCDHHGLILIEDAAMGLLSARAGRPVGSSGELSIFCLYKTFPLPDGAALICRAELTHPPSIPRVGLLRLARLNTNWLLQRSRTLAALAPGSDRRSPKPDLSTGDPDTEPMLSTRWLLPRVARSSVAEQRRTNYATLAESLRDFLRPLFPALPDGSSPIAYLTVVAEPMQTRLLEKLARAGIKGAKFWETPHPTLPQGRFLRSDALRATLIGLPVHQGLRALDLERISAASLEAVAP